MQFGGISFPNNSGMKISGVMYQNNINARVHTMPAEGWPADGTSVYPGGEYYTVREVAPNVWQRKESPDPISSEVLAALILFAQGMRDGTALWRPKPI